MKEIILKFSLITGETLIEAKGFKGHSCKEAMKFLEETLGEMSDFQKKAEWYEKNLKLTNVLVSNLCG